MTKPETVLVPRTLLDRIFPVGPAAFATEVQLVDRHEALKELWAMLSASPPAPSVPDVVREWQTHDRGSWTYERLHGFADCMAAALTQKQIEWVGMKSEVQLCHAKLAAQAKTIEGLEREAAWIEGDKLEALGTFGGRVMTWNGNWKICLNETNCELWVFKTEAEARESLAEKLVQSGYRSVDDPVAALKATVATQAAEVERRENKTLCQLLAHIHTHLKSGKGIDAAELEADIRNAAGADWVATETMLIQANAGMERERLRAAAAESLLETARGALELIKSLSGSHTVGVHSQPVSERYDYTRLHYEADKALAALPSPPTH